LRLHTENASFSYPGKSGDEKKNIFKDVNIVLESGHIMAILGPNGSGKTTFLRCLMGMLKWTSGKSYFDDRDTNTLSSKEFWNKVSYVPQQRMATSSFTAFETVLLGRSGQIGFLSTPKKSDIEACEQIMEELGIIAYKNKDCSTLSGGEFQMVLIAKALVSGPELLILDEPESGLDFRNQLIVLNTMDKLKAKGISCIFNTHYPKHALQKADCSLILGGDKPYFGKTDETVNEKTIEAVFGVRAVINEMQVDGEIIKNIVPLYVTEKRG
jgi:iron complex transport system ATP-binding protein